MNGQAHDSAQLIIQEMRRLGMQVRADPEAGKVRFGPSEVMPWELRLRLREHKPEVLALLTREAAEVAWRVAAMRPQVPARGPIPFLVAQLWRLASDAPRCCLSCGEALGEGQQVRCSPCVQAVHIVLAEIREGAPANSYGTRGASKDV